MPARNALSHTLFENRGKEIDYDRLGGLYFVGSYERRLPVSITRMMENAYDWEHLPYVHQSSFKRLVLHEQGEWGWRAIATLPDSRLQHLELLVDKPRNYWATTVLSGDAKGFEIHSHATQVSNHEIDVVINFYLPKAFSKVLIGLGIARHVLPFSLYKKLARKIGIHRVNAGDSPEVSILNALRYQYSLLYDEDEMLMTGRQEAIDRLKRQVNVEPPENLLVGNTEELLNQIPKLVQFGKHRYVINRWNEQWWVYSADCPHLLGPLEGSKIDSSGRITCPWHGYQFDIASGKSCSHTNSKLRTPPTISEEDGQLFLSVEIL